GGLGALLARVRRSRGGERSPRQGAGARELRAVWRRLDGETPPSRFGRKGWAHERGSVWGPHWILRLSAVVDARCQVPDDSEQLIDMETAHRYVPVCLFT